MSSAAGALTPFGQLWAQSRMGVKVQRDSSATPAPLAWPDWLHTMFPLAVSRPMGPHHAVFWDHVWSIDYRTAPRPFFGVWSREGGKSTNVECATVALGARGARRYALYVRATQLQADNSVGNIAEKLESAPIESFYPRHSTKLLSKFGSSRGWRRNRIRTAGGFTIDALGLDAAARGLKVGDDRPDLIIFDDIDDESDSPLITGKKRRVITRTILPAGSQNVAVIGIQNLVLADGIFTTIVDGRADYMTDKVVSGPHPAIRHLEWHWRLNNKTGTKEPVITGGKPTWEGQSIETCQRQMKLWGPAAFLREAQHEVREKVEGLALNFDDAEHFVDLTFPEIRALVGLGRNFGGIDFQAWRFGWTSWAADEHGVATRVAELFSQREELSVRARRIHEQCERLGIVKGQKLIVPRYPIWGDNANPQDILEINAAFKRGWRDDRTGRQVVSPLRVVGVGHEGKFRRASIQRINNKLAERAVRFARSVGAGDSWQLGYNAGSAGTPMDGSRLLWEIKHWAYDVPAEGKVDLKQDPSDHTADGADLIASMRYALMSWWKPAKDPDQSELDAFSPAALAASVEQTNTIRHRLSGGKRRRGRASHRIRHPEAEDD